MNQAPTIKRLKLSDIIAAGFVQLNKWQHRERFWAAMKHATQFRKRSIADSAFLTGYTEFELRFNPSNK